jgi:hypothetical protein
MSKKHFELLAQGIRAISDAQSRRKAAEAVSQVCAMTNPRFDQARFLAACGVEV